MAETNSPILNRSPFQGDNWRNYQPRLYKRGKGVDLQTLRCFMSCIYCPDSQESLNGFQKDKLSDIPEDFLGSLIHETEEVVNSPEGWERIVSNGYLSVACRGDMLNPSHVPENYLRYLGDLARGNGFGLNIEARLSSLHTLLKKEFLGSGRDDGPLHHLIASTQGEGLVFSVGFDHPEVTALLRSGHRLDDFYEAARILAGIGAGLKTYILVGVPGIQGAQNWTGQDYERQAARLALDGFRLALGMGAYYVGFQYTAPHVGTALYEQYYKKHTWHPVSPALYAAVPRIAHKLMVRMADEGKISHPTIICSAPRQTHRQYAYARKQPEYSIDYAIGTQQADAIVKECVAEVFGMTDI